MLRNCMRLVAVVCLLASADSIRAQQETRYTVVLTDQPAGVQTSSVKPDGVREFAFEYKDRGNGPKLTTRIKLDAAGLPISLETLGYDYSKAPVAESFTVADGVARRKNAAEAGEKKLAERSFYISLEGAPEEFALLAQLRLGGHVPAFMTTEQFIRAGADEIQHINFLFLNFLFDDIKDTRTPARHQVVAERAATVDLESERVRSFIRLLKDRKIVVDPTANIFEKMFTDRPGKISTGFAPIADRLSPQVRRALLGGGLPVPEGRDARYRESAKALLRMIKMLYDAGVTIVAGTDSMAGFALHRELELYVEAGIPAAEVLRIATLGAARVMKCDGELGSIAPGKLADLILVEGNPTERISDIRRTSLVIKDGNVYESAALYKSIGVRP